ncbi:MAG TPA: ABC transporter permease [Pseudolabrys sp.]|nr:ABC transporter permease [Pseudolabrys sp.]
MSAPASTGDIGTVPLPSTGGRRSAAYLYPILATVILFIVWELATRYGHVSPLILPPPSDILATATQKFSVLVKMSVVTSYEFVLGFLLAAVIGVPLGAIIVYARPVELTFYPLLVAFQTIPKAAIAPVLIVWLGTGITSKILIAFAISFFPIVVDTIIGLRSTQPETIYVVRAMGGSQFQVFWHVRLPNALPAIFGGLKVASTLAVIGAIVGEFVSSDSGIGYLLLVANGELDTRLVFACVLVLTVLGLVFFFVIDALEKLCVRWHVSARAADAAASGGH